MSSTSYPITYSQAQWDQSLIVMQELNDTRFYGIVTKTRMVYMSTQIRDFNNHSLEIGNEVYVLDLQPDRSLSLQVLSSRITNTGKVQMLLVS